MGCFSPFSTTLWSQLAARLTFSDCASFRMEARSYERSGRRPYATVLMPHGSDRTRLRPIRLLVPIVNRRSGKVAPNGTPSRGA